MFLLKFFFGVTIIVPGTRYIITILSNYVWYYIVFGCGMYYNVFFFLVSSLPA